MMIVLLMMMGLLRGMMESTTKNARHKDPSRWWDWCMSEDEKRETEKSWR